MLHELIVNAALFGVLADPAYPVTPSLISDLQAAARTLGRQLVVANARTDSDLEMAFATFPQQHVGAVLVSDSTLYARRTEQLAALAARHALPTIHQLREFALAGGLLSYGTSLGHSYYEVGVYTGRTLKMLWGSSGVLISIAALTNPMEPRHDETKNQDCERFQPMSRPAGYGRDGDRGDRRSSVIMQTFLRG